MSPVSPLMDCAARQAPPSGERAEGGRAPTEGVLQTPVLIIEDEAMIAWMVESLFEDMGFTRITVVATGEAAVAAATRSEPGLIVSDVNLGAGMDGIAAVAAIRDGWAIPTLFVTAYGSSETEARIAREAPGAGLLSKPINPAELRARVMKALEPTNVH